MAKGDENYVRSPSVQAFRRAIQKFHFEEKKRLLAITHYCEYCGSDEELTLDHKHPSFIDLATSFVKANGFKDIYSVPLTKTQTFDGEPAWSIADREFGIRWKIYHIKNVEYQILCRKCNERKGHGLTPGQDA